MKAFIEGVCPLNAVDWQHCQCVCTLRYRPAILNQWAVAQSII